jgi:hypothetical protein
MKKCFTCQIKKPFDAFHKNKAMKGGLDSNCKKCCNMHKKDLCQCGNLKHKTAKICRNCMYEINNEKAQGNKHKTKQGYISVFNSNHPYSTKQGYIMEHRLVMETYLGRYLTKDETVHHLNGIKDDNRIENLELWIKPQPSGVRVKDEIKRCQAFLEKYKNLIGTTT